MFGIDSSELLLVALVALVVIGPKDLPKAMRVVGYWVGKARGISRQFRQGFDTMVREAELEEMEKKWASENERIMREHPTGDAIDPDAVTGGYVPPMSDDAKSGDVAEPTLPLDDLAPVPAPVMVEKPVVEAAPADRPAPQPDGAPS